MIASCRRALLTKPLLVGAAFAALYAAPAAAADNRPMFNIPAQPVANALNAFSAQSGYRVLFPDTAGTHRNSREISGQDSPDAALKSLLEDSGLQILSRKGKVITLGQYEAPRALPVRRAEDAATFQRVAASAQAAPVEAAPVAEEIVVTAQRRSEFQRDVPISITTLNADQLRQAGSSKLSDIASLTPGLRFNVTTNFVQPTIRGIGTAVNGAGAGSNVGIYLDGFYVPNPASSNFDIVKIRSVQVLKGPQGTLFGRNTTGGAILITTAEPSTDTSGLVEGSYGRFNEQRYRGYVTTGLSDKIAVDLEGQYRKGDGFARNIIDNDDKIGRHENWSVRAGLKAELSDSLSVLLRYAHTDTDDADNNMINPFVTPQGQVLVIAPLLNSGLYGTKPGRVGISQPVGYRAKTDTGQMTIKADLGIADLTSYTQYRKDKASMFNDFDFTAAPVFFANLRIASKTFSQELLFTSKPGGPLQWTAGLFYYRSKEQWDFFDASTTPFFRVLANGTTTQSLAAYADATYAFTPQLFLTVGVRFSHDVVTDAFFLSTDPATFGQRFDVPTYKSDHLTPRIVLRYKPTDRSSVYASYTRGYKAGLLNVGGSQFTPVKPESISAYEAGYKYDDRIFSFDVAGFYYDYKRLQVSTYFNNSANITNAAASRIYGIDAQFRTAISSDFSINAGGAYARSEYRRFNGSATYVLDPATGLFAVVPVNIVNGAMQQAPRFTGNAGARYTTGLAGGRLALSTNLYVTSKFFFDSSEQFAQKGYELLSLRAEWTDPSQHFTAAIYGDNITNRRYRTQVFFNNLGVGNSWNPPVTYGASLTYKF